MKNSETYDIPAAETVSAGQITDSRPAPGFLDRAARIISTIFVPPSLTILLYTYFAFSLESEPVKRFTVMGVSYTFGFIFPIIMFIIFRMKGRVVDVDASVKEERTIPYFIATGIYTAGLIVLLLMKVNPIALAFWFCYISNTLIVIFINSRWKISAHALGVSGPLGALTFALGAPGFAFVILLLIVGWSRLRLKCHTPLQVLAGSLFGFTSSYLQIAIITYLMKYVA